MRKPKPKPKTRKKRSQYGTIDYTLIAKSRKESDRAARDSNINSCLSMYNYDTGRNDISEDLLAEQLIDLHHRIDSLEDRLDEI